MIDAWQQQAAGWNIPGINLPNVEVNAKFKMFNTEKHKYINATYYGAAHGGICQSTTRMNGEKGQEDTIHIGTKFVVMYRDHRSWTERVMFPCFQQTNRINEGAMFLIQDGTQQMKEITLGTVTNLKKILRANDVASKTQGLDSRQGGGIHSDAVGESAYDDPTSNAKMNLHLMQQRITMRNTTNHRLTCRIYEYTCRTNSAANKSIEAIWGKQDLETGLTTDQSTAQALVLLDNASVMRNRLLNDPDSKPPRKHLPTYWKEVNYTKVIMEPGRIATYTHNTGATFLINSVVNELEAEGTIVHMKGVTKKVLVIGQGPILSDIVNGNVLVGDAQMAISTENNYVMSNAWRSPMKRVLGAEATEKYYAEAVVGNQGYTNLERNTTSAFTGGH